MRQIKYILVNDSMPEAPRGKSSNICIDNLGHHYVVNSAGAVLKLIDVCQPGSFMPKPTCGEEDLNRCSIGIKYNGSLKPGTLNVELKAKLIRLLVDLRSRFPEAKILDVAELDVKELYSKNIIVSDSMNVLRRELSDYP